MGFQLRGTPTKVTKVAASLDDVRPDKGRVVKVGAEKKKDKKKEGRGGKAD